MFILFFVAVNANNNKNTHTDRVLARKYFSIQRWMLLCKKDIVRFWPRPDLNFRYHRNETIDYTSPRGGISVVNSENNSPEITSTLLIYQASWHSGQFRHVFLITISRLMDNVPNAPKKWSPKISLSCRYKALLSALQPIYYSASHTPYHLVSSSP